MPWHVSVNRRDAGRWTGTDQPVASSKTASYGEDIHGRDWKWFLDNIQKGSIGVTGRFSQNFPIKYTDACRDEDYSSLGDYQAVSRAPSSASQSVPDHGTRVVKMVVGSNDDGAVVTSPTQGDRLVVASQSAAFASPEVKRGVVAIAGALLRIVRTVGGHRAMEMALTGRTVSATEARDWGIVNTVAEDAPVDADVLSRPVVNKALEYAREICGNSPDSVIVGRAGVIQGWGDGSAEHASQNLAEIYSKRLNEGENIGEGLKAFVEKRAPKWVPSKL